MFLKLYPVGGQGKLSILPATRTRPWMKENPHVFKCGPITNCNSFGWDIVINHDVSILWAGGKGKETLIVHEGQEICHSNFGHGVLTFVVGYTWHTSPGWSLMVCPVPNSENDEWSTMSALIETDTLKYPFFPSLQFKRPGRWQVKAGTSIARVFPIQQKEVMECEPTIENEPEDFVEYRHWQAQSRTEMMASGKKEWQKFYHNIADYPVVKMKELRDARGTENTQLPDE